MDCLSTALRMSCVDGSGVAGSEDAVRAFRRKRFPRSFSCIRAEVDGSNVFHLKRKRAAGFFLSVYLCGVKVNEEAVDGTAGVRCDVQMCGGQEQILPSRETRERLPWCDEKIKRRKVGPEEWVLGWSNSSPLCRAPARLKRLLRRARAKVKRMGLAPQAESFHYDPLSYSMNFDDGFWRHSETPRSPQSELVCPPAGGSFKILT